MFISELWIENLRCFKSIQKIDFHEGINVIIGHNNSGKSVIMKALSLLFDAGSPKRLSIYDFNRDLSIEEIKKAPPRIRLTAVLTESDNEDEYSDDIVTISTWLTKLDKPYEAKLTYDFFLPEKEVEGYLAEITPIKSTDKADYWRQIDRNYIRKYTYKYYVGDPDLKVSIDGDTIRKFDFQFLDAIRDVDRDLFSGKNTLLKEVIDFFIDYDVKNDSKISAEEKEKKIQERRTKFSTDADALIADLHQRIEPGKKQMLLYADHTGATFDKLKPGFEGHISDSDIYSALRLIVEHETGLSIPVTHNGLGYNNLIYISLLLAKMQKDASGEYLGSNAKVFPILAIEEPEAHLHPSMQYKFLKFLKENKQTEVRQIFITTHSPNITAAIDLDDILVLRKNGDQVKVAYPGQVFSNKPEDQKSKAYVKRFLDVTKSDMLFANSVCFVEGITEQLLLPIFSQYLKQDFVDNHISVINLGGRYFNHFIKLFDTNVNDNAIDKKIACITDVDPTRSELDQKQHKKCYPFELGVETEKYIYTDCSNDLVDTYNDPSYTIRTFSQQPNEGKTFEYELLLCNPGCEALVTDNLSNNDEILKMMQIHKNDGDLDDILALLSNTEENNRIRQGILSKKGWEASKLRKHIIASRYLNSISKGENAQELAYILEEKLAEYFEGKFKFYIPNYISEAIEWVCGK